LHGEVKSPDPPGSPGTGGGKRKLLQSLDAGEKTLFEILVLLTLVPAAPFGPPDSLLHVGASVRVQAGSVGPGWLTGTVARSSTSPTCLAIRLEQRDAAGRPLYAFLRAVTALEVDQRTNEGVFTIGLPPAEPTDWRALTAAELNQLRRGCRRAR
jgi:hypothetical protein